MAPQSLIFLGLVVLVLAGGSALFSALETAFFSLPPAELERLRQKKGRSAEAMLMLLEHPRRLLSAILVADVLINVPLIVLCLYLLRTAIAPVLPFWAKALVVLGLVVFVCDLTPKLLALMHPYRWIRVGVRTVFPLLSLLALPVRALHQVCERLVECVSPASMRGTNTLSEDEVSTLVELGAEEGALHMSESAMIQEIIRLGAKTVRDCMTPRVDVACFPDDLTNEELALRLSKVRYRRVPIYGETPDEIVGILEVRAFLEDSTGGHYTGILMPPSFVPETMKALDLMRSFLKSRQAMAVVVDEHGGTEGVITRADLVEEILSEALPGGDRDLYIEALGDGRLVASGNARLDDIGELLSLEVDVEGIDTVGGLAFMLSGQLPRPGDVLEGNGLRVSVRRTSRKRVEEVLVERSRASEPEDEEAA
ncbi:MAG: Magnesium and cobalt efflux protein CorC [Verrucomicrobiota bacterium]